MSRGWTQAQALLQLQLRHLWRSAINPKAGTPGRGAKQLAPLLLRLLFLAFIFAQLWNLGAAPADLGIDDARSAIVALQLAGVGLLVVGAPLLIHLAPSKAQRFNPMLHPLLATLPLHPMARAARAVLQQLLIVPYGLALAIGASPEVRATPLGWAKVVGVGLGVPLLALSLSHGLSSLAAVVLPIHRRRLLVWPSYLLLFAGFALLVFPTAGLGHAETTLGLADALGLTDYGELLIDPDASLEPSQWLWPFVLAAASLGVGACAERIGFDQVDAEARAAPRRGKGRLDWVGVGRLLSRREGGRMAAILLSVAVLTVLGVGVGAVVTGAALDGGARSLLLQGGNGMLLYMGALVAMTQANRAVLRDVEARTLLSVLPIEPQETLRGKAAALRWLIAPILFVQLLLALVSVAAGQFSLGTRIGLSLVAFALTCDTLIGISFLTRGLAAASPTRLSFERFLALFPLLGIVAAPSLAATLPLMLALVLVRAAANRAAARAVQFFDDPGDLPESRSEVWRAALVFATFIALQSFAATFIGPFVLDPRLTLALAFSVSAVALLLMTLGSREGRAPLSFRPRPVWTLGASLLLGVGSGALALAYLALLGALGWEPQTLAAGLQEPDATLAGRIALIAAVVGLAPVAEETFFRGWLQEAVESELAPPVQRYGFVIVAAGFASAHPAVSFVPVFILGLIAGGLRRRGLGLWCCIAAHLGHNAVAVWFS